MLLILNILMIVLLGWVVFSDFTRLSIPLVVLLGLIIVSAFRAYISLTADELISFSLINMTGTTILVLFSFLVLMALKRNFTNPLNRLIGAGDLVFFPVICFSMSPINFLFFLVLSFLLAIIISAFLSKKLNGSPLAGIQSALLIAFLMMGWLTAFDTYSDKFLINLIVN